MPPTRDRILDAAESVLRTAGVAHATTKEIARAAGFSEATLYKHFPDKTAIFVAVLKERLPPVLDISPDGTAATDGGVEENLTRLARSALDFYLHSFPISVSVFSSRAFLAEHAAALRALDSGPHRPLAGVAAYLARERDEGRLRPDADVDAAAALLLGACFQRVFLLQFDERPPTPEQLDAWATAFARTTAAAVAPPAPPEPPAPPNR
ncbi:MAG TPA: TetR/AcrR family transcriptional regulator [Nocardia sp.]|uniref:TetR/AcrR family transcriptional regulator n=1 Tax=Nocardia TaxID=1817 RepID=UPI002456FF0F|nr:MULTISPECIES: TetR/AcrR family transcriptional regulator [Nocardia]HLS79357.1 TetR/AcrR family transcriptional regulator [Nocardia sp.]